MMGLFCCETGGTQGGI